MLIVLLSAFFCALHAITVTAPIVSILKFSPLRTRSENTTARVVECIVIGIV